LLLLVVVAVVVMVVVVTPASQLASARVLDVRLVPLLAVRYAG
jgi:hypothetical protein